MRALALVLMCIPVWVAAQGSIRGVVADGQTGEALIGANVVITDPYKGAMADLDGRYSLDGLAPGTYKVTGSFIGYTSIVELVTLTGKEVVLVNFNLLAETVIIDQAAEVIATVDRARDVYMENIRKKDAASLDYISSQQIRRTGDSDAAGAMRRVTGVSTVGNFIFVRGLSDRYLKTTLNGLEVPSINPRRNTLEMDIFPTNLVDNLVVVKTQSANLPGDWSGAYLNVITKDFPDAFMFNFTSTLGYNDQSTFREVLSSQRSSTDWLGYDDGFRGLPAAAVGLTAEEWPFLAGTSFYDGLVYMGYADELAASGINGPGDIGPSNPIGTVCAGLGITLDSLETYGMAPASEARNAGLTAMTQSFNKAWDVTRRQAPLDLTQSLSFGNQTQLFGRSFGYIFGMQYKRQTRYWGDGEYARYTGGGTSTATQEMQQLKGFNDAMGTENVYWNMLLNLSYKLNEFNKISALAMPNFSGQNESRFMEGFNYLDTDMPQVQRTQRYEQRQLNIWQARGEHFLPGYKTQIQWNLGYSGGVMRTPDLRVFYNNWQRVESPILDQAVFTAVDGSDVTAEALQYINEALNKSELPLDWASNPDATIAFLAGEGLDIESFNVPVSVDTTYTILSATYPDPTRYYRTLHESKFDAKLHVVQPILPSRDLETKFSAGLSFVRTARRHEEQQFEFEGTGGFNGSIAEYMADSNMVVSRARDYVYAALLTDLNNTDRGTMDVLGAYAMLDAYLHPDVRLNAGVRVEQADMLIRSARIDEATDLTPQERDRLQGTLNDFDVMPSLNVVWAMSGSELLKVTNLRFAYSRSIARPVFREKSPFRGFDFETLETLKGNPGLDGTKIDNVDLRFEHFPNLGEIFSASLFYKRFTDPIEQTSILEAANPEYTWSNIPYSNAVGLELEGRKTLGFISEALMPWSLGVNLSLIRSRTAILEEELRVIRATDPMHPNTRPLFGQSPYILNTILTYAPDSSGFQGTVAFNLQGPKLFMTQLGGMPDIYQQPFPSLDLTFSQTVGEHFACGFRAFNLLNPLDRKTYDFGDPGQYNWLAFRTGRTFSLSFTYRI
jgi:TonB-dependent receptor